MLLSAAVTSASSKQTQQRWICFQRCFTPFDSMVTKFITFSPTNNPPHLHFRWLNLITGWTISKISTPFHQALMALGIRRSAMGNSNEIFKKNAFAPLAVAWVKLINCTVHYNGYGRTSLGIIKMHKISLHCLFIAKEFNALLVVVDEHLKLTYQYRSLPNVTC